MPDILDIQKAHISYGEKPVIKDVTLAVKEGETFGLIGLNGVGKTTLIKAILGLRKLNGGAVTISGLMPDDPKARENFSYLPERFDPPWFLSGLEFVKFSLRIYGTAYDEAAVISQSEKLALDPLVLKNRVQTYSKGMRQKLGLIATFMSGCPLLILDEPMSGLDPKARSLVKDMFAEARKSGRTIFLSSHILSDMNEICDRVSVLDQGELTFTGKPADLRKQGKNENLEKAFLNILKSVSSDKGL